jgi:hypothetical protein
VTVAAAVPLAVKWPSSLGTNHWEMVDLLGYDAARAYAPVPLPSMCCQYMPSNWLLSTTLPAWLCKHIFAPAPSDSLRS